MSLLDVLAALLSAVLHAGWNAVVKVSPRPTEAMAAQMLWGAVLVIPTLPFVGFPAPAAWPWMIGSCVMSLLTVRSLLTAYGHGGFGVVYPVSRALSVLFVVPVSALLVGDRVSTGGLLGIGLIICALALLALGARRGGDFGAKALAWTFAAGVTTAAYVICDGAGVRRSGTPLGYAFTVSIMNALVLWRGLCPELPIGRILGTRPVKGLATAVAAMLSYGLVLWVMAHAPVAIAAALRDTSAVFAVIIAVVFLAEPFTRLRLFAVLLAAAAVPLLRLG